MRQGCLSKILKLTPNGDQSGCGSCIFMAPKRDQSWQSNQTKIKPVLVFQINQVNKMSLIEISFAINYLFACNPKRDLEVKKCQHFFLKTLSATEI